MVRVDVHARPIGHGERQERNIDCVRIVACGADVLSWCQQTQALIWRGNIAVFTVIYFYYDKAHVVSCVEKFSRSNTASQGKKKQRQGGGERKQIKNKRKGKRELEKENKRKIGVNETKLLAHSHTAYNIIVMELIISFVSRGSKVLLNFCNDKWSNE